MAIKQGDHVGTLTLPEIKGDNFNLEAYSGKCYLLGFFRFASCPFCNMRVHELVEKQGQLPEDFKIVAIFDSPLDNLQRFSSGHNAPFPILADRENIYYQKFGVRHSVFGMLLGMVKRFPTMLYAMFAKGYIPWRIKGSMTTMPLDLLVDENGIIQAVYSGKDEGDHMPFEQILAFAGKY